MSCGASIPVKTKTSYPISLAEAKRHLRLDEDFRDDDDYVENLIKAATQKAEEWIGKDIAETENIQQIFDFSGDCLQIDEGNLISFTEAVTDISTLLTVETTKKYYNSAVIEFTCSGNSDPLTIKYKTGFEEEQCPALIKQAILLKIGDLYDVERQSYTIGSLKENKAFEYLLNSYRYVTL